MTYVEMTAASTILSVTREEIDAESESCTVVFRIHNETKWKSMIHSILKSSLEAETFGVTVRQEYYLNDENKPAYVWSMLLWGDLEEAKEYLSPILSKRGAPPAPPKTLAIAAPMHNAQRAAPVQIQKNDSLYTEVQLPFKRNQMERSEEVIRVSDHRTSRKPRAFVEGVK